MEANTTDVRLLLNILVTPEHILVDTGESDKSILRRQYASLYSLLRLMPELVRFVGPKNIHVAVTQAGFDDSKVGAAMTLLAKILDLFEISYDIASHGPSETFQRVHSKKGSGRASLRHSASPRSLEFGTISSSNSARCTKRTLTQCSSWIHRVSGVCLTFSSSCSSTNNARLLFPVQSVGTMDACWRNGTYGA
jgi:hypothetical protein